MSGGGLSSVQISHANAGFAARLMRWSQSESERAENKLEFRLPPASGPEWPQVGLAELRDGEMIAIGELCHLLARRPV